MEIQKSEWRKLAETPCKKDGTITVHGVGHRDGKVWIVKNCAKPIAPNIPKPEGWGLPTGGVKAGKTPIQGLFDEFKQETGIFDFEVNPMPIDVSVKSNGHINICFLVSVDPYAEPRPRIFDPAKNTSDVALLDYQTDLEEHEGRFWFRKDELFYSSHRTLIVLAENTETVSA